MFRQALRPCARPSVGAFAPPQDGDLRSRSWCWRGVLQLETYEYMSKCSYIGYSDRSPQIKPVAATSPHRGALTRFSQCQYYAGSDCNWPSIYTLRSQFGNGKVRAREGSPPVRLRRSERSTCVIEVQHITKRYGNVTAVDDVSFRVERGEILGFLGPNGAGKTTTMRILTGYMPATEGKAIVAGFDVFEHPLEAKRRTGYLPETPPLYPDMTVREYLDFVARIKGVSAAERKNRVDTVMQRTRVDDMASRHCGKLSK